MTKEMHDMIENNFTYHAPKDGQKERYEKIRYDAKNLALLICEKTPAGREQSIAIRKIEEAVFWANAAIARGE